MVHLDYRDARPIYTQIIDGFTEQIRAGVLRPGDRLPSVRELAAMLTINPNTIQRAYRELDAKGWVASVPGKGCFVCDCQPQVKQDARQLLDAFDSAVGALLSRGHTRQELIDRLNQGGNENA